MIKIVKTDGILEVGQAQTDCIASLQPDFVDSPCLTEEELIKTCTDADGLLVLREPVTAKVIEHLHRCRVISRFGVGLDSIDIDAATRAGITVTNVPDSNADEVATHTMAMLLALARRLPTYDRAVRAGDWDALRHGVGIHRLDGLVLGLIGIGRIGQQVARLATSFGMRVHAYDPMLPPDQIRAHGAEAVTLDEVVTSADVLSLHTPLNATTTGLLGRELIDRMKPGSILLNVSRGGLVDELALAEALRSGHLAGAGIDAMVDEPPAPDHPLLALSNVILTPHAAHYSKQSYAEVRTKAFADLAAVLNGRRPRYQVN